MYIQKPLKLCLCKVSIKIPEFSVTLWCDIAKFIHRKREIQMLTESGQLLNYYF